MTPCEPSLGAGGKRQQLIGRPCLLDIRGSEWCTSEQRLTRWSHTGTNTSLRRIHKRAEQCYDYTDYSVWFYLSCQQTCSNSRKLKPDLDERFDVGLDNGHDLQTLYKTRVTEVLKLSFLCWTLAKRGEDIIEKGTWRFSIPHV